MFESQPKISVILPFYNANKTILRAVLSIKNQTFTNFECILVDNNSTDDSKAIVQTIVDSDHRFKLVSEKKQGVTFASNKGWETSTGEYIARMDADDWSHPTRLEKQNDFLDSNPDYGAVGTLVNHMSHSEYTGGMARFVEWSNSLTTYDQICKNRFIELPIVNPTAMWRRQVAAENGMYLDGNFPEDYEMWLRWLDKGVKIGKIKEVLLDWYDSDNRLSRTHKIYSDKLFYKIKTKYLADWLEKNNPFHPKVAIWGASKISRRRAKLLEEHCIEICCYIDTKNNKRQIDKEVHFFKNIPSPETIFVLTYIKQREAREATRAFLIKKGYNESENFLVVS